MKPMKYLLLTTIFPSLKSFVLPLAVKLQNEGFEVTVGSKSEEGIDKYIPDGLAFLPLKIERGFSIKGTVSCIWQLFFYFRKNHTDVAEYGTENVSFCAAIAAWMAGVAIRIYNHWGPRYVGYTGLARYFSIMIEKTAVYFSTDVREQSPLNMQMCIKDHIYPASKVKVVGYGGTVGADFSKFDISRKSEFRQNFRKKFGIKESDFVFGDVGNVRKDKGSEELIRAFKNLDYQDAYLVFVGVIYEKDPIDHDLMNWAQSDSRVIFAGRVTDVEHYVSAFDCMVHPSYREGLGMVLQEAGAMGIPSITTRIPGPSEFGEDGVNVLLAAVADTEDLQKKMSLVYQDRALLGALSSQVFLLVKERYERNIMISRHYEDRLAIIRNRIDNE